MRRAFHQRLWAMDNKSLGPISHEIVVNQVSMGQGQAKVAAGRKETRAEISNEKGAAKEVAIEKWENEGGEVLTIARPSAAEAAIGGQQSKGDESRRASEVSYAFV
jgi:hypothetical protein